MGRSLVHDGMLVWTLQVRCRAAGQALRSRGSYCVGHGQCPHRWIDCQKPTREPRMLASTCDHGVWQADLQQLAAATTVTMLSEVKV